MYSRNCHLAIITIFFIYATLIVVSLFNITLAAFQIAVPSHFDDFCLTVAANLCEMNAAESCSGSSSSAGISDLAKRLKAISDVEQKIMDLMKYAQTCMSELSREKQISKSKMEEASSSFKRCLSSIESDLCAQMQYLSHVCVGTAHQGSTFATQQNAALAEETLEELRNHLLAIQKNHLPADESSSYCQFSNPVPESVLDKVY
ncbi:hypothetical protein AB6A40_007314 [Gnathostoma spinigerum]|uniref:Mediator of RNA polymerase II transcription subunit 11 n=1 Tax=Gnathostoma spinigerum TaxID=75299 RepID=A0ABD6EM37_9BILA